MRTDTPKTIYLKDYTPPAFHIRHADLRFEIFEGRTLVHAKLDIVRKTPGENRLFLNGEHLKLLSCTLDGKPVDADLADKGLYAPVGGKDSFVLETVSETVPENNTALEGLYRSEGNYCTQCEPEGFRRITWFIDRPDNMGTFRVRIEADAKTCPVLLSNGNLMDEGALDGGRHYAVYDDPTPKSPHLFALVAGDLVHVEDRFKTMSGNDVRLRIYVRKGDEGQCAHAMAALKKSMAWDEAVYGREYQYSRFDIVAVSDFNMGAMENTSLNIFNTALVLAHPDTATDRDFIAVEGVIAHEYFHNWTGNRVTCRDWFQLSLKEGLTVFRDQEFSSDMNSRPVQRIDDVMHLRRFQFPEDGGPLSHPIRPDNYIEINNFYTMTVYEKGAEVIRMFQTLLGPQNYRKATDLYFDRYDGQAVTCEDWIGCMEDASGLDLTQFRLWYSQAGTPEVSASGTYDAGAKTYTLTLRQRVPATPGQNDKKPMHIPVAFGLIGPNGDDLIGTKILDLRQAEQVFTFTGIGVKPVPSILRGFSAPVKLTTDLTDEDLRFLMIHDSDGFNRFESGQAYALRALNRMIDSGADVPEGGLVDAIGLLLTQAADGKGDKALLARALSLPDTAVIGQTRDSMDPPAIYAARKAAVAVIAQTHRASLERIYRDNAESGPYAVTPDAMARREIKNIALRYLNDPKRAKDQYDTATNMTDRVAALAVLAECSGSERDSAFAAFYNQFKAYPLVIDKWFSLQAMAPRADTIERVRVLRTHHDFTLKNPNRVRSLYSAFAMNNPVCFHAADGSGYGFLKDAIIALNATNPQIAARLLTPFKDWRRYTPDRQAKMKAALEEIAALKDLSPDVFEIASKSLKA